MDKPQLNFDWSDLIHRLLNLVIPRSDDILSSSSKLGELLTICSQLIEIEPIVRQRATSLALQKHEVLGWTLIHRDGNRYVHNEIVRELVSFTPAKNLNRLLETLTKQLGNVSETKYRELCASAGLEPNAEAISQTGATVFLRCNPEP